MHVCSQLCGYTCACVCMSTCVHRFVWVGLCMCMYVHVCAHICVGTPVHVYLCPCVCSHLCGWACACTRAWYGVSSMITPRKKKFFFVMCVCMACRGNGLERKGVCMPWCVCGHWRTSCASWFYSSTTCGSQAPNSGFRLGNEHQRPVSRLASPLPDFFRQGF